MKKRRWLLFLLTPLLLVSCGSKHYEERTYAEIEEKISNNETFILFAGSPTCHSCGEFKTNLRKAGKENKDIMFEYVNVMEFQSMELSNLRLTINSLLPESYFTEHNYSSSSIYTPSFVKYLKGTAVYSIIGDMAPEEIIKLYNFNFVDIGFYQNFLRRIVDLESFQIVFYGETEDSEYLNNVDNYLKKSSKIAYYIEYSSLSNNDKTSLLDIVNEDEETAIEILPNYLTLSYDKGTVTGKYLSTIEEKDFPKIFI